MSLWIEYLVGEDVDEVAQSLLNLCCHLPVFVLALVTLGHVLQYTIEISVWFDDVQVGVHGLGSVLVLLAGLILGQRLLTHGLAGIDDALGIQNFRLAAETDDPA